MRDTEAGVRSDPKVAWGWRGEARVVPVFLEQLARERGVAALGEDTLLVEQREEALARCVEELQHGLQPYVMEPATVCDGACNRM